MKPGQLVECVDDFFKPERAHLIPRRPKKGNYYIVRRIKKSSLGRYGVLLEELVNPFIDTDMGMAEPCFKVERFREVENLDWVVEEILEELLVPVEIR